MALAWHCAWGALGAFGDIAVPAPQPSLGGFGDIAVPAPQPCHVALGDIAVPLPWGALGSFGAMTVPGALGGFGDILSLPLSLPWVALELWLTVTQVALGTSLSLPHGEGAGSGFRRGSDTPALPEPLQGRAGLTLSSAER